MPDATGRFKGISVPELPWLKRKPAPPSPTPPVLTKSVTSVLTGEDWRDIGNGRR